MLSQPTNRPHRCFELSVLALAALAIVCLPPAVRAATVLEEEGKTFIIDQKGERWDVTQALSLGFSPEGFQFGIGRDAIRPLDDQHLGAEGEILPDRSRVIGISLDEEGHAYSITRLTRHEIANTRLGDTPLAAAY